MKNLAKAAAIVIFISSLTSCDWISKSKTGDGAQKVDTNTTVIEETPVKIVDTTAAPIVTPAEKTEKPTAQPAK